MALLRNSRFMAQSKLINFLERIVFPLLEFGLPRGGKEPFAL
ncbi:MAG: hypothetical protein U9O82_01570 [Thermodesulfobacteriota bacterium]|nr:hypothetical protein [Thermodesulfobacteriota bacterium]